MASYKLVMNKWIKNEKGAHPIYSRVIINRKKKDKSTGIYLHETDWNPDLQNVNASAPHYQKLSLLFDKLKSDMKNRILDLTLSNTIITHENIWATEKQTDYDGDMIAFIEDYISQQKPSRTRKIWQAHLARLKEYTPTLNMHTTPGSFIESYRSYLENDVPEITTYSTVHSHLKTLRKFWNVARRMQLTENYPFAFVAIPNPQYAEKPYLNKEERLRLVEMVNSPNLPGYLFNALVYFLIACYSGLRYSDWDQCGNIQDGNLAIKQKKGNKKLLLIPIGERLQWLLQIRNENQLRVFTDHRYREYLKELAQRASIEKHMTTTYRPTYPLP